MFASKDTLLTRPSGYNIARSVRTRASASAYFNRTPASASNRKTWTWSAWVKRGTLSSGYPVLFMGGATQTDTGATSIALGVDDKIYIQGYNTNWLVTTQVFRDPSAWYHIIVAMDSTNATANNRLRLYVNGVEVTAFSTRNNLTLNTDYGINQAALHCIAYESVAFGNTYFDGYMTEVNFVDGQQLTPSSFGSTNAITGVWQPAKYTGTYGTNGFYLNFSDNSNNTAATIGKDYSGNGNNWTPNNISVTAGVTYDSMQDVPTLTSATAANYAVINPVFKSSSQPTISNGNLTVSANVATYQNAFSTIGSTSGKQYCEITITGAPNSANMWGVANAAHLNSMTTTAEILGSSALSGTGYGYYYDGRKYTAGTLSSYGNAVSSGDVMGIALDLDNGKVWFSLNGTWQASGDPAAGTNAAFTGIVASGTWFFGATAQSSGSTAFNYNFGQRPFSYTPPTGFVALNTYNLPASTITNGAAYMAATTYTGNADFNSITNSGGFQPDFVWVKERSEVRDNILVDSVRGVSKALYSNLTSAEGSTSNFTEFLSNGFKVGYSGVDADKSNKLNQTYVGWQWKAGTTSASNTNGSITSTVSVGATQGFSVVTYTGTGANATVGHGLGVAPKMIIVKDRSVSTNWAVYNSSLTSAAYVLLLNLTAAETSASTFWNSTAPTSSVFSIGTSSATNTASENFVAYCFAAVAGYSAFGSFVGNGTQGAGPFVYLGFRPRYVLIKNINGAYDWHCFDTSRGQYNYSGSNILKPNASDAELTARNDVQIDFLSNGFRLIGNDIGINQNGSTHIYITFAENPFRNALAF
jgi:hypothetical protein